MAAYVSLVSTFVRMYVCIVGMHVCVYACMHECFV
jgi:hypothetical protein